MGSELTSVSAILGLNSISAADKRASAPRLNALGSRKGSIASRQPHPLLSIVQTISTESAVDAGALGFMAKFLVQTTLPHSEQFGTQYVRSDGNLTLRISDVGGAGMSASAKIDHRTPRKRCFAAE